MNTTTKVFAAVWTDVFEQPKVKVFATRQAAEDWAKGFSNVSVEECEVETPAPKNHYTEMTTDQIREEMDREERCNLAGVPYIRPSELD